MIPIKNFTPIGVDLELPPGYTVCEYLETEVANYGGPYINTELPARDNLCISIDFQTLNKTSECWVFGYWAGRYCTLIGRYHNYAQARQGIDATSNGVYYTCDYQRHKFGWDRDSYYVDGVPYTGTGSPGFNTYTTSSTFLLFRSNHIYRPGFRVWSFEAFDQNGNPVSRMIPCLDLQGVPCMYDVVRKKSYYNVGQGTFKYKLR